MQNPYRIKNIQFEKVFSALFQKWKNYKYKNLFADWKKNFAENL